MQIEKAQIDDHSLVSKEFWKFQLFKFRISTICNFAVIHPWKLLFSYVPNFLTFFIIVFSVYKQIFTAQ